MSRECSVDLLNEMSPKPEYAVQFSGNLDDLSGINGSSLLKINSQGGHVFIVSCNHT